MARLIFLGTAAAVPDEKHENTHMALVGQERLALIDCVGNPMLRLKPFGVDLAQQLTDLILTHFHPDHISGVPSLLMTNWLVGRTRPLHIYGLDHTLERIRKIMDMYDWNSWPRFYPVHFHSLPEAPLSPVLECPEWRIQASPVEHIIPTIGLRITLNDGPVIAYSCDTRPCPATVELAQGADILIHEATGESKIHSSPEQAGAIAAQAGVGQLYLIHYPPAVDPQDWLDRARSTFAGPVSLAQDLDVIEL